VAVEQDQGGALAAIEIVDAVASDGSKAAVNAREAQKPTLDEREDGHRAEICDEQRCSYAKPDNDGCACESTTHDTTSTA